MKEVEVKVKINSVGDVKKDLEEKGFSFSLPIEQRDVIYANPKILPSYDKFTTSSDFLRVRRTKDKNYFTFKRPQTGELDVIERETEISNPEQVEDILKFLGFEKAVNVNKKRMIAKRGDYEVSLDEVEGLGSFLEVEKIVDMETDSIKVQEEIWEFLAGFGIDRKDEITRGYDTLVYLKNK